MLIGDPKVDLQGDDALHDRFLESKLINFAASARQF
jgi:hypothetical protein